MISHKMMTNISSGNFENSFLEWEKMPSRKIYRHFLHTNFFMFMLLISNYTVFLIQFGINWQSWVCQKAKIALSKATCAISAFWKTHSCKLFQIELQTVWLPILTWIWYKIDTFVLIKRKGISHLVKIFLTILCMWYKH